MLFFISSTDSAVDVEASFDHNLKKRKRKKRKSTLVLNQSHQKKKKINYGQQVKIKKVTDEEEIPPSNTKKFDPEPECSNQFNFTAAAEVHFPEVLQTPVNHDSSDSEEINVTSDDEAVPRVSPFVQDCIQKCKDVFIEDVVKNFDKEGLLLHFMAFMQMISSGQLSVVNMAVLLSMEMALLFPLVSTTQMRYRSDTSLFWETVLSVGGPRMLRLFSSDKHFGQVNSGESAKSKYNPKTGNFNFAVPDEKTIRKSRTGLPTVIKCGIIDEAVNLVDKTKEFVLSMDGKQLIPGLINESEGDVNLWGYEGPPTLWQNLDRIDRHKDIILNVVGKVSIKENSIHTFASDLKLIVQLVTKCIRDLHEAKVRHEQLRARFAKKVAARPDIGSKYSVAFPDIDCFIHRADIAIHNMLQINLECQSSAVIPTVFEEQDLFYWIPCQTVGFSVNLKH